MPLPANPCTDTRLLSGIALSCSPTHLAPPAQPSCNLVAPDDASTMRPRRTRNHRSPAPRSRRSLSRPRGSLVSCSPTHLAPPAPPSCNLVAPEDASTLPPRRARNRRSPAPRSRRNPSSARGSLASPFPHLRPTRLASPTLPSYMQQLPTDQVSTLRPQPARSRRSPAHPSPRCAKVAHRDSRVPTGFATTASTSYVCLAPHRISAWCRLGACMQSLLQRMRRRAGARARPLRGAPNATISRLPIAAHILAIGANQPSR